MSSAIPGCDPSVAFERDYYLHGAVSNKERDARDGHYYTVMWKVTDRSQPVKVRLEYRQQNTGSQDQDPRAGSDHGRPQQQHPLRGERASNMLTAASSPPGGPPWSGGRKSSPKPSPISGIRTSPSARASLRCRRFLCQSAAAARFVIHPRQLSRHDPPQRPSLSARSASSSGCAWRARARSRTACR